MSRIFISYRREDTAPYAGRLFDRLGAHFGSEQVFMDIDRIEPGENFVEAVNRNVAEAGVMLVLIGPGWARAADTAGRRRLDDPHDFVRIEVAAALARGVRVIPVRVGGAPMPHASELPAPLQPLVERQAIELSDERFHADVDRLIEAIDRALALRAPGSGAALRPSASGAQPATAGSSPRWRIVSGVALLLVAAGGGIIAWLMLRAAVEPAPARSPVAAVTAERPGTPVAPRPPEHAGRPASPAGPPAVSSAPIEPPAVAAPADRRPAAPAAVRPAASPSAVVVPPAAPAAMAAPAEIKAVAPPAAAAGPIRLRVQDTFAAGSSHSAPLRALLGEVGGASAAAVKFDYLTSTGANAAAEAMAALRRGTLDVAWLLTSSLGGRDEAFHVLEGPPLGPTLARYAAWRADDKVRAIAERMFAAQDLKGIACAVAPGWDLWLKAPLQSGADLRGRKVRAVGLRARVYAAAGASLVPLSPAEVQRGLAAGVIDAAEYFDTTVAVQARLHEVARRWHAAPLSRASGIELVFRRSAWERLDAATRQRIEQVCARSLAQSVKTQADRIAAASVTLRESGAAPAPLPPAVSAALSDAWRRVQSELAANSAAAALLLTVAPYSSSQASKPGSN